MSMASSLSLSVSLSELSDLIASDVLPGLKWSASSTSTGYGSSSANCHEPAGSRNIPGFRLCDFVQQVSLPSLALISGAPFCPVSAGSADFSEKQDRSCRFSQDGSSRFPRCPLQSSTSLSGVIHGGGADNIDPHGKGSPRLTCPCRALVPYMTPVLVHSTRRVRHCVVSRHYSGAVPQTLSVPGALIYSNGGVPVQGGAGGLSSTMVAPTTTIPECYVGGYFELFSEDGNAPIRALESVAELAAAAPNVVCVLPPAPTPHSAGQVAKGYMPATDGGVDTKRCRQVMPGEILVVGTADDGGRPRIAKVNKSRYLKCFDESGSPIYLKMDHAVPNDVTDKRKRDKCDANEKLYLCSGTEYPTTSYYRFSPIVGQSAAVYYKKLFSQQISPNNLSTKTDTNTNTITTSVPEAPEIIPNNDDPAIVEGVHTLRSLLDTKRLPLNARLIKRPTHSAEGGPADPLNPLFTLATPPHPAPDPKNAKGGSIFRPFKLRNSNSGSRKNNNNNNNKNNHNQSSETILRLHRVFVEDIVVVCTLRAGQHPEILALPLNASLSLIPPIFPKNSAPLADNFYASQADFGAAEKASWRVNSEILAQWEPQLRQLYGLCDQLVALRLGGTSNSGRLTFNGENANNFENFEKVKNFGNFRKFDREQYYESPVHYASTPAVHFPQKIENFGPENLRQENGSGPGLSQDSHQHQRTYWTNNDTDTHASNNVNDSVLARQRRENFNKNNNSRHSGNKMGDNLYDTKNLYAENSIFRYENDQKTGAPYHYADVPMYQKSGIPGPYQSAAAFYASTPTDSSHPEMSDGEIEQLYDYVRGLAPLPKSCRPENTSKARRKIDNQSKADTYSKPDHKIGRDGKIYGSKRSEHKLLESDRTDAYGRNVPNNEIYSAVNEQMKKNSQSREGTDTGRVNFDEDVKKHRRSGSMTQINADYTHDDNPQSGYVKIEHAVGFMKMDHPATNDVTEKHFLSGYDGNTPAERRRNKRWSTVEIMNGNFARGEDVNFYQSHDINPQTFGAKNQNYDSNNGEFAEDPSRYLKNGGVYTKILAGKSRNDPNFQSSEADYRSFLPLCQKEQEQPKEQHKEKQQHHQAPHRDFTPPDSASPLMSNQYDWSFDEQLTPGQMSTRQLETQCSQTDRQTHGRTSYRPEPRVRVNLVRASMNLSHPMVHLRNDNWAQAGVASDNLPPDKTSPGLKEGSETGPSTPDSGYRSSKRGVTQNDDSDDDDDDNNEYDKNNSNNNINNNNNNNKNTIQTQNFQENTQEYTSVDDFRRNADNCQNVHSENVDSHTNSFSRQDNLYHPLYEAPNRPSVSNNDGAEMAQNNNNNFANGPKYNQYPSTSGEFGEKPAQNTDNSPGKSRKNKSILRRGSDTIGKRGKSGVDKEDIAYLSVNVLPTRENGSGKTKFKINSITENNYNTLSNSDLKLENSGSITATLSHTENILNNNNHKDNKNKQSNNNNKNNKNEHFFSIEDLKPNRSVERSNSLNRSRLGGAPSVDPDPSREILGPRHLNIYSSATNFKISNFQKDATSNCSNYRKNPTSFLHRKLASAQLLRRKSSVKDERSEANVKRLSAIFDEQESGKEEEQQQKQQTQQHNKLNNNRKHLTSKNENQSINQSKIDVSNGNNNRLGSSMSNLYQSQGGYASDFVGWTHSDSLNFLNSGRHPRHSIAVGNSRGSNRDCRPLMKSGGRVSIFGTPEERKWNNVACQESERETEGEISNRNGISYTTSRTKTKNDSHNNHSINNCTNTDNDDSNNGNKHIKKTCTKQHHRRNKDRLSTDLSVELESKSKGESLKKSKRNKEWENTGVRHFASSHALGQLDRGKTPRNWWSPPLFSKPGANRSDSSEKKRGSRRANQNLEEHRNGQDPTIKTTFNYDTCINNSTGVNNAFYSSEDIPVVRLRNQRGSRDGTPSRKGYISMHPEGENLAYELIGQKRQHELQKQQQQRQQEQYGNYGRGSIGENEINNLSVKLGKTSISNDGKAEQANNTRLRRERPSSMVLPLPTVIFPPAAVVKRSPSNVVEKDKANKHQKKNKNNNIEHSNPSPHPQPHCSPRLNSEEISKKMNGKSIVRQAPAQMFQVRRVRSGGKEWHIERERGNMDNSTYDSFQGVVEHPSDPRPSVNPYSSDINFHTADNPTLAKISYNSSHKTAPKTIKVPQNNCDRESSHNGSYIQHKYRESPHNEYLDSDNSLPVIEEHLSPIAVTSTGNGSLKYFGQPEF